MGPRVGLEEACERSAKVLREATGEGWNYRAPEDDNPKTWTGLFAFAYADTAYRYVYQQLALGGDGTYCPSCGEERPAGDWHPALCMAHWWDDHGYEAAVDHARWIGGRTG
jgi:hypothetical protein